MLPFARPAPLRLSLRSLNWKTEPAGSFPSTNRIKVRYNSGDKHDTFQVVDGMTAAVDGEVRRRSLVTIHVSGAVGQYRQRTGVIVVHR